jgi:hypothetical protein
VPSFPAARVPDVPHDVGNTQQSVGWTADVEAGQTALFSAWCVVDSAHTLQKKVVLR